jgi:stage V sporulation protein G
MAKRYPLSDTEAAKLIKPVKTKRSQSKVAKAMNPGPPNADNQYPCLKITSCQVFPIQLASGKTKALARCMLNEQIQLTGLRIVDGVHGLFVAFPNDPSYKGEDYKCIYYPVTRELREHIENTLIEKYQEMTTEEKE